MKVKLSHTRKSRIEMIPLIDIVFLIMVTFIYSTLSMAVHRGLSVFLPTSSVVEVEKQLILSVTITGDKKLYVDKEPIELDRLTQTLSAKIQGQANPGVLLFADNAITYQDLFKVLDHIRMAGLSRISLQAEVK
ncbi:Biopolymer transport protein ExbD/TolR family [uncultured Desulfobacterium sp.]|uniref:Biopolymer transport protein ExbD/TolR family n=1 Tax=uncultured Desulfobacterium sp. TaxID=201089 RepID=A0A445MQQ4_9BACT|nr:Biopolymer transport protein ExbD/TolR family [uncultured Desulfobacterium sp.]